MVPMVVPIVSVEVSVEVSVVPKVSVVPTVSMVSVVPMVSVVVYDAYSVYDAYGHKEIVPYFLEYTTPSNRTLLKAKRSHAQSQLGNKIRPVTPVLIISTIC